MSSSWSYLDPVILPFITGETVLDAGCGMGRWGTLIETNHWESDDHDWAGPQTPPAVDGCDAFAPNVELCRQRGSYRHVWQQTLPSRLDGLWDTVLACELIEHIPGHQVEETLDCLEAAAATRVIVSTPNSPNFREGHDTPLGFNPLEAHLSYVPRRVLIERGYRVYGAGFGRYDGWLAPAAGRLRLRRTLTSLPHRLPLIAETIVAVRTLK